MARVFIEAEMSDASGLPIVVELDIPHPSEPAAANATHSIWSLPVNSDELGYGASAGLMCISSWVSVLLGLG
jgi:hypothetical protein